MRVEFCPAGYRFVDYPRLGRNGEGIGLLHRDSMRVTTVRTCEEESFDYSEFLIQLLYQLLASLGLSLFTDPHLQVTRLL